MHVQSISHWAPANIGPYSQAVKVGDLIHLAGQIGLIPGSMQLLTGGFKQQCKLSLRHIGRLVKALDSNLTIRDVVQVNFFVFFFFSDNFPPNGLVVFVLTGTNTNPKVSFPFFLVLFSIRFSL